MRNTPMVQHPVPSLGAWWRATSLLLVLGAGALGCISGGGEILDVAFDSSIPESGAIDIRDGGCRELVMVAQKFYKPNHSVDAEITLSSPLRFNIPTEAQVVVGNAGNQLAKLEFTVGNHEVACLYKGGASKAHPTSPADIEKGKKYILSSCTGGTNPGDIVSAEHFTFHLVNGDDKDPADATIAGITLNEAAPCTGIGDSGADADAQDAPPDVPAESSDAPTDTEAAADVMDAPSDASLDVADVSADAPGSNADASDSSPDATDASSDAISDALDASTDAEAASTNPGCGDGIRDPLLEECDFGATATRALCSADCRVNDLLAVLDPSPDGGTTQARTLGEGRHPLAVSSSGSLALAYVEPDANPLKLSLTTYSPTGIPSDVSVAFSTGSTPVLMSNPVIAAVPNGKYVVAYTDFNGDGDELGVALRIVDPASPPIGPPAHANSTTAFSQYDADILAIPSGLVVAWIDDSNVANGPDIMFRTFDNNLSPTSGEQSLAVTSANEGDVALAPFGGSWAAAWRAGDSGLETLGVRTGSTTWSIGPYLPGPVGDRPALAELDATHLLVVYTEGTDPEETGVSNGSKLRVAVLDTASPGTVTPSDVTALVSGNEALAQSHPNAIRVGSRVYIAWRTESALGDANAEELWLKLVGFGGAGLDLSSAEIPLPRSALHRPGDQRRPALAASLLGPEGTLVTAFDDLGKVFTSEGNGDPAVEAIPLPLLRLP
jgi:hypothetical protein